MPFGLPTRAWKALRLAVTIVIIAAVAVLFGHTLASNWEQVSQSRIAFSWNYVIAVVIFAVAVPLSGLLWGQIVRTLDREAVFLIRETIAVHCASWLLKYIPGQVGSLLNKIAWGAKRGISRTLILITFVYENVFLQLASIVPSAVILLLALGGSIFSDNWTTVLLPLLAVVPLVAISQRAVFRRVIGLAGRRVLKAPVPDAYFLTTRTTLLIQLEYVVPRILNAVGFVLIAAATTTVTPDAWLPLGATYVLAGAIGILAVFVPSGLGVREAVIVLFASQYMSVTDAILVSLASRLISTIADALVALIYAGLRFSIPKDLAT